MAKNEGAKKKLKIFVNVKNNKEDDDNYLQELVRGGGGAQSLFISPINVNIKLIHSIKMGIYSAQSLCVWMTIYRYGLHPSCMDEKSFELAHIPPNINSHGW